MRRACPGLGGPILRATVAVLFQFLIVSTAAAQAAAAAAPTLPEVQQEVRELETQLPDAKTGKDVDALHDQAVSAQSDADRLASQLGAQLSDLNARLAQLGPAPASSKLEDPLVRQQRRQLMAQQTALDGQVKQAKLLAVAAGQAADSLADRRRALFNEALFQRGASPLSAVLWTDIGHSLPSDLARLRSASVEAWRTARAAPEPRTLVIMAVAFVLAAGLAFAARSRLEVFGRRRAREETPASGLRRSGYALWMVLVDTACPALAALAVYGAAQATGVLSERAERFALSMVVAVVWGSLVTGLGRALLSVDRPAWRLAPIEDRTAQRLRPFPWVIALVTGAGILLTGLNRIVGASLSATLAAETLITLVYVLTAGATLVALGRGRTPLDEASDADTAAKSSAWSLAAVALVLVILLSVGAALAGYTAFAARLAGQMFWTVVLVGAAYVVLQFVDDLLAELFRLRGWAGRALFVVFGLRPQAIQQIGVLTSGALRVLISLGVLTLILIPFGQGGDSFLGDLAHGFQTLRIGSVVISPLGLLGGALALIIGVVLVRLVQRWLDTRYLPVTGWDTGVRNSVRTGVGYLGMTLAVLWALASAGLGLQRIALIASALSVGIGFGLQQVVQNFVSGLILLVERPVKVGDWVALGTLEGDIQNIRVRATEILTADKSTLIVPNSELVTKTVQNKTLGAPRGRVQIQLTIADPLKVQPAVDAVLGACADAQLVLNDPAPVCFIDSVTGAGVALNAFCYVASPRDTYGVRSNLYLDILKRFADQEIVLSGVAQSMVVEPGPTLGKLLEARNAALSDEHDAATAHEKTPEASPRAGASSGVQPS